MGGISDGPFCNHVNTDTTWSEGQNLKRCLDCGAIKEKEGWVDIPGKIISLLVSGKSDAAKSLHQYTKVAREQSNIPYPEISWEEYYKVALSIVEPKKPKWMG